MSPKRKRKTATTEEDLTPGTLGTETPTMPAPETQNTTKTIEEENTMTKTQKTKKESETAKTEKKAEIVMTDTGYIVDGYEIKKERVISRLCFMSKPTHDLFSDLYGKDINYVIAEKIAKEDAEERERQRLRYEELEAKRIEEERQIIANVRKYYESGKIILISRDTVLKEYPSDMEFTLPEARVINEAVWGCGIIYGEPSELIHMVDAKVVQLKERDMQVICIGE